MAVGAGVRGAVAAEFFAHGHRIGLAQAALEIADDALEGVFFAHAFARRAARLHGVAELDLFLARAIQHHVLHRRGQGLPRRVRIKAQVLAQALDHREVIGVAAVPAFDRTAGQAQRGKGHHALGVEHFGVAQTVAGRAGAHGRVERKQAGFELAHAVAAHGTSKARRKAVLHAAVEVEHQGAAIGQAQRGLEALGQALAQGVGCAVFGHLVAHLEAVDHHVDVVLFGFLQRGQGVGFDHLAVDPKAHKALRLHLRKQVNVFAFFLSRHGCQHHQTGLVGHGQHGVHHLRHALRGQGQVVFGAVRGASAGEEQTQVIVDLGDRAHGGARVVAGGLLLNRDRGRQALDQVHIGLVHQLQKLPRIGRQTLHVAALAFGVERVKGQTRFARTGQARDHHQSVFGDVQVDVFEVVRARTAHRQNGAGQHRARGHHGVHGVWAGCGPARSGQPSMISPAPPWRTMAFCLCCPARVRAF